MGIPGDILSDQVLCEQWTVTPKLTERVNHTLRCMTKIKATEDLQ